MSRAIALDVANARAYFAGRDRAPGSRATGFATSATDRIS
ncbi:bifunctional riboflavin kinase/FMN adenylyltransferase [Burkholderia sp. TJI49]|nr:bifunctional riboflavin kinase/FMN adenylyltransferase [Burkholderia sp. TJI49]